MKIYTRLLKLIFYSIIYIAVIVSIFAPYTALSSPPRMSPPEIWGNVPGLETYFGEL